MRRILVSILFGTWCLQANASPLSVGSDAPACNNMLRPGMMAKCEEKSVANAVPVSTPTANPALSIPNSTNIATKLDRALPLGGVSEAMVDEYLASYGKPPREAVRALMNPTDENIAAMAIAEQKRQVIAGYVAQRWTEYQQGQSPKSTKATFDAYTVLPMFVGMRLSLYVSPGCGECEAAVLNVRKLVEENPVLDSRLVIIANDERATLETLMHLGVSMPVSTVTPQQATAAGIAATPVIEIIDTRNARRRMISGIATADALREAVIQLRKSGRVTNEAHINDN